MSVINKMLRDLDARRVEGALPDLPRELRSAAMQGTTSVRAAALRPAARRRRRVLLVLLLLTGLAAAGYLVLGSDAWPEDVPAVRVADAALAASAPAPVAAASAPESVVSAPVPMAAVVASPGVALVGPVPRGRAEPPAVRGTSRPVEPVRAAVPAAPPVDLRVQNRQQGVAVAPVQAATPSSAAQPAASTAAPSPAPASSPAAAPALPQRRQTAAQEALAQAQGLWSSGSREAALDLVRDAVGAVERAQPVDVALLTSLVREQVRMELALGRPEAALAVLSRLEPVLSGQADLWALRGNVAQRLGRHQESVQAYLSALQLRPGESRWMLGAAVSLAALGQLEAAAQQAEQARALGPVSPEVWTYLRQAGVPLR